jgi:luciferase family oxidoreductase group 1
MRLQIPFSVLDLSTLRLGETPRVAFQQTVDYPDRIDLGPGRASGGHDGILRALRVGPDARNRFPSDVRELQFFFREPTPVPGAGLSVPIWLLGSSTFSAEQAGAPGLPFGFATHIGPNAVGAAIQIYRSSFKASEVLARPHVMITVLVVAVETDEAARYLFTSIQQIVLTMLRGEMAGPLPPPVHDLSALATPQELAGTGTALRHRRLTEDGAPRDRGADCRDGC